MSETKTKTGWMIGVVIIILMVSIVGLGVFLTQTSVVGIPKETIAGENGTYATIKGEMGLLNAEGNPINTSPIGAFSSGGKSVTRMYFHFQLDFEGQGVDWTSFWLYYKIDMSWPGRSFVATGSEGTLRQSALTGTGGYGQIIVRAERGLKACFDTAGVSLSSSWERDITFRLEISIKIKDLQGNQLRGNVPDGWWRGAEFLAGTLKNDPGTAGVLFQIGEVVGDPAKFG